MPKDSKLLTAENLSKLGVAGGLARGLDDAMSDDFSVLSNESEILPTQNVLDLRISRVEFYKESINAMLDMKDALPSAV